eukprot:gb/GECH01000591.1/.p1 GENE.gb/GECH01000591.1/~~gb/GECH01000591.1/.p1  ORF type:complete len:113 (+),score=9.83 gb/GECH01000591.1/:1-339(+)
MKYLDDSALFYYHSLNSPIRLKTHQDLLRQTRMIRGSKRPSSNGHFFLSKRSRGYGKIDGTHEEINNVRNDGEQQGDEVPYHDRRRDVSNRVAEGSDYDPDEEPWHIDNLEE